MNDKTLVYLVNHLFFPFRLPDSDDYVAEKEGTLCAFVLDRATAFREYLSPSHISPWNHVIRMLEHLRDTQLTAPLDATAVQRSLAKEKPGDVLVYPIRAQNACVIIRKLEGSTIYESFEVEPPNAEVMGTASGRLIRSFPGPAISLPNETANDACFQTQLASFLCQMDAEALDSAPITVKAKSTVHEVRDTADPHYITTLLTSILRGYPGSSPADTKRIDKHVRNDIVWKSAYKPWRRSSLWLVLRVALQTTLDCSKQPSERYGYKAFMVFLMANVLFIDNCGNLPAHLLHCMQVKIARRLHKLSDSAPDFVVYEVKRAIEKTRAILDSRWLKLQTDQSLSPTWDPRSLDIQGDTTLSLLASKPYITERLQQHPGSDGQIAFNPSETPRLNDILQNLDKFMPGTISRGLSREVYVALHDIEYFVQEHIDRWVDTHHSDTSASVTLAKCIKVYADQALIKYANNPEEQSAMLLTILQLWVALDQICVAQLPMLKEFSPEIPVALLKPLLLRTEPSIRRFLQVQKYLSGRHLHAHRGSIFSSTTFAIRHFDNSPELQQLRRRIEADAQAARNEKVSELDKKKATHQSLLAASEEAEHAYDRKTGKHISCFKCKQKKKAKKLSIDVHEWPLPPDDPSAKAAVFELQCPVTFRTWRDITFEVLYDICRPESSPMPTASPPMRVSLDKYSGLLRYGTKHSCRIKYASTTKSFTSSHYANIKVSDADVGSVCVNNGLTFRLFDSDKASWVSDPFVDCALDERCTFKLPSDGPYHILQYAVNGTTHTSNMVIAQQNLVPLDLTLHEHAAFGTLRSGAIIQWLNIARELRSRTLSFACNEVQLLVTQAASQVGPAKDGELVWHGILKNPQFTQTLLTEMDDLLSSIEGNWHHVNTLQTLIFLAARILASKVDTQVAEEACVFLKRARIIAFAWMQHVSAKMGDAGNETAIRDIQVRICTVAATCRATYDVDAPFHAHLLVSDEDVRILVECSIQVHDNIPRNCSLVALNHLLSRDRRLSQSIAPLLWSKIAVSKAGLDQALAATWTAYVPGSTWTQLTRPNDRWITTFSSEAFASVHFNLLDGALLINGKPLGRLPSSITTNPTYIRILGEKILDVIPSNHQDMDFATRGDISASGFQLHFKLLGKDQLIIKATHINEVYELIPHHHFIDDFPTSFIERYTHWLRILPSRHAPAEIEFRPLESRWEPSPDNWRVIYTASGSKMRLGASLLMVDFRSNTYRMISTRLKPLEIPDHIHITSTGAWDLSVDLPRFKLSFFLNINQELESSNLRGMVIDSHQFSGTMVGLSSQLTLRAIDPCQIKLPQSRCVIIPFGDVVVERKLDHVKLDVHLEDHVRYFKYDIDTDLGCLVGSSLLISDLYKIFLHACTSYPLPDPLTGHTGTEEALSELSSAKCTSFQSLGDDERNILRRISDLVPERVWYPDHLKVMETIHWRKIPPLAQHWGFDALVKSILQFDTELSIFKPEDAQLARELHAPKSNDMYLQTRSASLNWYLYPTDYAYHDPHTVHDKRYPPLNRIIAHRSSTAVDRATLVTHTSALVQRWPDRLHTTPDLWSRLESFGTLSNDSGSRLSLAYQSSFLDPILAAIWIPFYDKCRTSWRTEARFQLGFSLPAMVYGSPGHVDIVPTMLSFATLRQFSAIDPPPWTTYNLRLGISPDKHELRTIITEFALPLDKCPSRNLPRQANETLYEHIKRQEEHRVAAYTPQVDSLVGILVAQWPCSEPLVPQSSGPRFSFLDLTSSGLKHRVGEKFQNWFRNLEFHNYVARVQEILDNAHLSSTTIIPLGVIPHYSIPTSQDSLRTSNNGQHMALLGELISQRNPGHVILRPIPPSPLRPTHMHYRDPNMSKLQALLAEFTGDPLLLRNRYGRALEDSHRSYNHRQNAAQVISSIVPFSPKDLFDYYQSCGLYVADLLGSIVEVLSPRDAVENSTYVAGQWPRVTMRSLLGLLSETCKATLTERWKATILLLAQSLVRLQHAQRLVHFAFHGSMEDFLKELENDQFEEDIAFAKYPEWLLIQIDGNFAIRPIQSLVAEEMMTPSLNRNSILQLNMGEGKSSVIVPLIASSLADGHKMVRVIVLKPLANSMFQLLVRRVSGLANRRVFYFPFSRDVQATRATANKLQSLFNLCMRERGILIVQPEHILSFKLMGIDLAIGALEADVDTANSLLASQRWLTAKSRDILDESDEILSIKYQLVYTSGQQEPLEDHPDRWITIQEMLRHIKEHARRLHPAYPRGLEVDQSPESSFPLIRILDVVAGNRLIVAVAEDMLNKERFRLLPPHVHRAALQFVTCQGDGSQLSELEGTNSWTTLLLYRGLLGCGLLRFVLQEKRWRVDYGLDRTRTLLAVPYRAKDVPTLRADFGHPDVAIALTCLSYYYGGLNEKDLNTCLELLFQLDNPALEYEAWIADDKCIPSYLREIIGINMDDMDQRKNELYPMFRGNHAVIDFYLRSVVFPKEAKQFPKKLATSAWDLAETKTQTTTGFSGTNDNRDLLPTSIEQHDPLDQLSTNARVLSYLLRSENDHYTCLQRGEDSLESSDFLKLMVEQIPPVRVLLDVGAQMLDLQNVDLARCWISLAPDLEAIVFFDAADHLMVMTRDHSIEPFVSSQYNQKLDLCGIYLDDAHTRGTDLKFPVNFRAGVTLGPKLTKDRLVQGCMRMRKLGHGHSVMFIAPPEVDRSIRKLRKDSDAKNNVTVLDILRWVMSETCDYIEHHLSHWAQQGIEHKRRSEAWAVYDSKPSADGALDKLRASWEEPDARTLEEMYAPTSEVTTCTHPAFEVPELANRLRDLGIASLSDSKMDEEQEREVSHEAERERQVERPPKAQPAQHNIHPDVISLVTTGKFSPTSPAFVHLFSPLRHLGDHEWSTALWATKDFSTTVKGTGKKGTSKSSTDYLRPVNWILSVASQGLLIALSPFEVNELISRINESRQVHLHVYSPRVTKAMKSFEDLKFFCIPPLPSPWTPPSPMDVSQLNLWAGQLYLKDFGAYSHLCLILGLMRDDTTGSWESDGFIKPEHRCGKMALVCKLSESPLPFLKNVMGLRRKGMNYLSTHMGKILNAGLLTEADFKP